MYFLLIHLVMLIFQTVNADKGGLKEFLIREDFLIQGEFFQVDIQTVEQIQTLQHFLDNFSKQIEDDSSIIDIVQIIRKRLELFREESSLNKPTEYVLDIPTSLKILPYSNESIHYINFMDKIVKYTRVMISLLKTYFYLHQESENSEILSQAFEFIHFLNLKQISLMLEGMNSHGEINPSSISQLEGFQHLKLSN